jgi:hypothetical protein
MYLTLSEETHTEYARKKQKLPILDAFRETVIAKHPEGLSTHICFHKAEA